MSQKIIRKGNLEYRERKAHESSRMRPVLIRCPICETPFNHGNERINHFRNEHNPSDFGLSPLKK